MPGGGGVGGTDTSPRAGNGSANTGGGAGGDTNNPSQANEGGDGGSGIVIVKDEAGCSGIYRMQDVYNYEIQGIWPT